MHESIHRVVSIYSNHRHVLSSVMTTQDGEYSKQHHAMNAYNTRHMHSTRITVGLDNRPLFIGWLMASSARFPGGVTLLLVGINS